MNKTNLFVIMLAIGGLAYGIHHQRNSIKLQDGRLLNIRDASLSTPSAMADESNQPECSALEDSNCNEKIDAQLNAVDSVDFPNHSQQTNVAERREQVFTISGLTAKESKLYVAVFESEDGFPKPELSSQTVVVSAIDSQVRLGIDAPLNQPFAIAVFQDTDGNGRLSKSKMGAPTEPYGFSNNARGLLGPPSFEKAALLLQQNQDCTIPINIKVR